jgi:hypothetical protein
MKQSYTEEATQLFRKPKGQIPYSKSTCPVPDKFSPQATNQLFQIFFIVVPYILKSITVHSPTDALFIKIGQVYNLI